MRLGLALVAVLLGAGSPAGAQVSSGPPGPYAFDVRGVVIGLPTSPAFYPALRTNAIVPARAFGVDAGGQVLFASWGAARIGAGAHLLLARGSSIDAVSSVQILAPTVSLNFGHRDGWSYVSAGIGTGRVHGRLAAGATGAPTLAAGQGAASGTSGDSAAGGASLLPDPDVRVRVGTWNAGGGARWFMSKRMAVGFDIRLHKLGQGTGPSGGVTPGSMVVAVAAGLSLR